MRKPSMKIFDEKVESTFNNKLATAVKDASLTGLGYDDLQIQELKLNIFNKYYKWPKIELLEEGMGVSHSIQEVSVSIGSEIIGNGFHFSMSQNTVKILVVCYKIPFKGDIKALNYTVNLAPRYATIQNNNLGYLEYFLFSQRSIEEEKENFKLQRDQIIAAINDNQEQVNYFFESKKDILKSRIDYEVDEAIKKALKHKADNDSLL
jgi:hypothetical protein